jgi:hypothetical protein
MLVLAPASTPSPGLAEVLEVAEACLVIGDEHDVIAVVRPEHAQIPLHGSRGQTTHARLIGAGLHLIERWIASHGIGKLAGIFRIRAAELDDGRCTAAFAVAEIRREIVGGTQRQARGGIEAPAGLV